MVGYADLPNKISVSGILYNKVRLFDFSGDEAFVAFVAFKNRYNEFKYIFKEDSMSLKDLIYTIEQDDTIEIVE